MKEYKIEDSVNNGNDIIWNHWIKVRVIIVNFPSAGEFFFNQWISKESSALKLNTLVHPIQNLDLENTLRNSHQVPTERDCIGHTEALITSDKFHHNSEFHELY